MHKKNKSFSAKETKIKPWMTFGMVRSIRQRDKLSKQLKKQPFNPALRAYFHNYRNTLNTIIKAAKDNYYKGIINDCRNENSGKILGKSRAWVKTKKPFSAEQFLGKGNVSSEEIALIANSFNDYYVGVGANLASVVPPLADIVIDDSEHRVDSNFSLGPITEEGLLRCVKDLKGGSAPGVDDIPARIIKDNIVFIKGHLLHIVVEGKRR